MKRCLLCLIFIISLTLNKGSVYAEEREPETRPETKLEELVVTGEKLVTPTKETSQTVYTGQEVTKEGMKIDGSRSEVSVYNTINILPGLNVENVDPYGLSAEQKNLRVRGVRGYLGSMSVAGVPNWGGNPIGPRDYLYDTENFNSVAVYKGAVPADISTGVGARGGAIELRPQWPSDKLGLGISQGVGMDEYTRSFFRVDSGSLPTVKSKLSLSYSYTDASKWKGPGDMGPRNNLNFMLAQPYGCKEDEINVFFNFNDIKQDLYRPLTYLETQDLSRYYRQDYNSQLTGKRLQDINYYKYNRGDYNNQDILSVIPITLTDAFRLNFKPYYANEDSEIWNGVTSQGGLVQKRTRDVERFGMISALEYDFSLAKLTVGYWFEFTDMTINVQNYNPVTLAYQGFGVYQQTNGDGFTQSPFLTLAGNIGKFDWQAGLKYFYFHDPSTDGYVTTAPNYYVLQRAADLDRDAKTYDEWLPSVGLAYNFLDSLQVYTSYGRNQIRPYSYVPIISLYNQYRSRFQKAGITLNDLFNGYNMETSDNVELGARFRQEWGEIMPALYFAKHDNLLTTIYDPRVDLNYQQNVGNATGWGAELTTNFFLRKDLTFFVNPSFTRLTYDDDLTYAGYTLDTKGNQVVDTPEWMLKTGLIYNYKGFEITPSLRYLSSRYGDATNKEKIDGYVAADLMLSFTTKKVPFTDQMKLSLEMYNLFDNKYVSVINVSDDNRGGAASYYAAPPFTLLGRIAFLF